MSLVTDPFVVIVMIQKSFSQPPRNILVWQNACIAWIGIVEYPHMCTGQPHACRLWRVSYSTGSCYIIQYWLINSTQKRKRDGIFVISCIESYHLTNRSSTQRYFHCSEIHKKFWDKIRQNANCVRSRKHSSRYLLISYFERQCPEMSLYF